MNITKKTENNVLTIALAGRLDTVTAPELENEIRSSAEGVSRLILDFTELAYISSAGLRVLLSTTEEDERIRREPSDPASQRGGIRGVRGDGLFGLFLEIEA